MEWYPGAGLAEEWRLGCWRHRRAQHCLTYEILVRAHASPPQQKDSESLFCSVMTIHTRGWQNQVATSCRSLSMLVSLHPPRSKTEPTEAQMAGAKLRDMDTDSRAARAVRDGVGWRRCAPAFFYGDMHASSQLMRGT